MAKTATKKEMTIAEKLDGLYDLQRIDSEIDRIRTIRGELPLEVQDLEDELEAIKQGQLLPIDSVSNCSQECEWKADTFDNIGMALTEYCEECGAKRD